MKRTLDIWPGNSFEDIAKIDIFFSDCDCVYRGNIYNKDGKMIGDYSAKSSTDIPKMFPQLVFNWD